MSDTTEPPTIDSLLADRARYEAWLEQLAAKASQVPAHVVARVQADYEGRLNLVVAALTDRADELRAEVSTLSARVTALDAELTAKRDARAEDELRALVGEHEDTVWSTRATQHDAAISAVVESRERAAHERDRLQAMLGAATRPSRAATPVHGSPSVLDSAPVDRASGAFGASPPQATAASADAIWPLGAESAPAAPAPEAAAVPPPAPLVAPVQAEVAPVVPPSGSQFADPLPAPTFNAPPSPRASRPSSFDEIAFLDTVVGRSMVTPAAPAVPQVPSRPSSAVPDPFADAVLDPVLALGETAANAASDAARSLKCQECGWMNVPTEWYCEKCGGELSAF